MWEVNCTSRVYSETSSWSLWKSTLADSYSLKFWNSIAFSMHVTPRKGIQVMPTTKVLVIFMNKHKILGKGSYIMGHLSEKEV